MQKGAIVIEGHVQGLSNLRSLGQEGIPVWVMDQHNCIAKYSRYCTKFIKCSPYDSPGFIAELIELGAQYQLKDCLLIPSNDRAVYNLSRHMKELMPYYTLFSSDIKIIENIVHKKRLLKIAINAGISVPPSHFFTSAEENPPAHISYPMLIKGDLGQEFYKKVGKKVLLVERPEDLNGILKDLHVKLGLEKCICQPVINRKEYVPTLSFCCLCSEGEVISYWMGEKLNEHPVRYGTATLARSTYVEEVVVPSKTLIKELNYTGICEIEWIYNKEANSYNLIEINPRTWLWVGLARACGRDFVKMMFELIHGEERHNEEEEKTYKTDIYWYNPITYYPFKILALISGVSVNSPKGKKINALFVKGDRKPGWMYLIRLFSIFRRR